MCFFYFTFYYKCVIINIGDNVKEYVLLIPSNIKNKIIKKVREKYYNYNIKFMTMDEFVSKFKEILGM